MLPKTSKPNTVSNPDTYNPRHHHYNVAFLGREGRRVVESDVEKANRSPTVLKLFEVQETLLGALNDIGTQVQKNGQSLKELGEAIKGQNDEMKELREELKTKKQELSNAKAKAAYLEGRLRDRQGLPTSGAVRRDSSSSSRTTSTMNRKSKMPRSTLFMPELAAPNNQRAPVSGGNAQSLGQPSRSEVGQGRGLMKLEAAKRN